MSIIMCESMKSAWLIFIHVLLHFKSINPYNGCSFILDNIAERGAVFIARNSVELKGRTVLQGNTGPAIRVSYVVREELA